MPLVLTHRASGGVSEPPYDCFNLATHVGDDAAAVAANRAELGDALRGLGVRRMIWMSQVHGSQVAVVDSGDYPSDAATIVVQDTDGLVTAERGVGLVVLVADCVPIVLRDEAAGVVGVVHAGRRGAMAAIATRAVESMAAVGARDISAHLGPSICGACYEVPEEMRDEVDAAVPGSACTTRAGKPGLDLATGVTHQLELLGASVTRDPRCTMESEQLFSYRRDGATGRFAAVAWLD